MADRETVVVTLFSEGGDIFYALTDTVEWLAGLLARVPDEHRKNARFEVEYESGWYDDSGSVTTSVYYTRPETDTEVAARLAQNEANAAAARRHNEERERQIFEQLKRKYG